MSGTEETREAAYTDAEVTEALRAEYAAGVREGIRQARGAVEHELSAIHPESHITRDGALTSALAAIDALEANHE